MLYKVYNNYFDNKIKIRKLLLYENNNEILRYRYI